MSIEKYIPTYDSNPQDYAYRAIKRDCPFIDQEEPDSLDVCDDEPADCCDRDSVYKLLVLADPIFTDPLRNDYSSFLVRLPLIGGSVTWYLQKWNGSSWNTVVADLDSSYGTLYIAGTWPQRPKFTGYKLQWRNVLIAFGEGIYRVNTNGTFFGFEWTNCSHMYCLKQYSSFSSDRTVRFEWNNNGIIMSADGGFKKTDFGNINWQDMIRIGGIFGFTEDQQEVVDISFFDGSSLKNERVRDRTNYTYKLKSGYLPYWVHAILKDVAFKSNSLTVTDYNRLQKHVFQRKAILKEDDGYHPNYENVYFKWYNVEVSFKDKLDDLGFREECTESGQNCQPVTIKDQAGNVIDTVPAGGVYVIP